MRSFLPNGSRFQDHELIYFKPFIGLFAAEVQAVFASESFICQADTNPLSVIDGYKKFGIPETDLLDAWPTVIGNIAYSSLHLPDARTCYMLQGILDKHRRNCIARLLHDEPPKKSGNQVASPRGSDDGDIFGAFGGPDAEQKADQQKAQ